MAAKNPQIIILLGRSGCGKGTQAKLLQKRFGFDYLGSGELLRKAAQAKGFTGRKLTRFLKKGILAPLFLILRIWSREAERLKARANVKGVIIDGSPRRLLEAQFMDDIFNWYEWKNILVVLIDISEKEAFNRLGKRRVCVKCGRIIPWLNQFKELKKCDKCGGKLQTRSDDNHAAIRSRMNFYKEEVKPVVEHYRRKGYLVTINGENSIEGVYRDIVKLIK